MIEIRTRDLHSTKHEFYVLDRHVQFAFICWIPHRFASDTQGSLLSSFVLWRKYVEVCGLLHRETWEGPTIT